MSMVGKDGRETAKNGGIDDDNLFEELEGCDTSTGSLHTDGRT
jgi:hypothetical protein